MGTITTQDGREIFYKDWGSGQPIVFSHGWPLSADDWALLTDKPFGEVTERRRSRRSTGGSAALAARRAGQRRELTRHF